MSIRVVNSLNFGGLLPAHVSRDALQAGAEHIEEAAQEKAPLLVDVERANREEVPGTLRDSAYVRVLDDVTAEIGFTDFIARRMHEDLGLHHDDGQAKFLEAPMSTDRDVVLQIIADKIREGLQS